jgi:hypothetical protein
VTETDELVNSEIREKVVSTQLAVDSSTKTRLNDNFDVMISDILFSTPDWVAAGRPVEELGNVSLLKVCTPLADCVKAVDSQTRPSAENNGVDLDSKEKEVNDMIRNFVGGGFVIIVLDDI